MRNPFRTSALAAIALVAVVGCASTTATPAPPTAPPATPPPGQTATPAPSTAAEPGVDDGTRITAWTRASTQSQAQMLVAAYNATHKNQVDMQIVPNDNMQTKVGAAAAAGSLPDIISGDVVFMPNWASQGLFTDITANIAALPYASTLVQGPIKASTVGGKQYGLPFIMDLSVWVYNKDLFTKAGLDPNKPPTTLAEYAADADAIQKLNIKDTYGTEIPGQCFGCEVFTWWPTIWADGGQVMNAEGTAATLNTDEAKKVYAIYQSLVKDTAPGDKSEAGATWVAGFQSGKVGIQPYPGSILNAIPASVNYGVAPIAGLTAGTQSTFIGGDAIGITSNSKHADQAWNFLAWTMSDYAQTEIVAKNLGIPVRSDLANNKYSAADPRVVIVNQVAAKGQTPLAKNFGAAFNDPAGPWGVLTRDVLYGGGATSSKLDAENAAITKVLAGS
ncbi:MAG: sugar ABC transporter substrate-binding protein [Candidatus Limnocylindrales bacterium]